MPPYRLIWGLNASVTILALAFFTATDGTAMESFAEGFGRFLFYAGASLCMSLPVVAAGTAIFLVTKRALQWLTPSSKASWLWLGLPAWIPALLLFAYSFWNSLPQQRLREICKGNPVAARDIRVVGVTGMQVAEWFASFEVNPGDWQRLVQKLDLKPLATEEFVAQLEKVYLLRKTALVAELRGTASTTMQCYKCESIGVDGRLHGTIYAGYDVKTLRAVVLRSGF